MMSWEQMMDRSRELGEGRITHLLIKFSVPAIVGMMVNALYNVVDRIFVGQGVGSMAIAGITVGFPMMIVLMAFGMLIGQGANALIAIRLGEGKRDEAELIMGNAMVLLVVSSLALTVLGLTFMDPLLRLFGASEAVLPFGRAYMKIILYGSVFQGIGFGMNNFIRSEGNPKIAMMTMLIGAVLNTILDPIFIYLFKMGIKGAAWATILSQAASAAWVLWHFAGGRSVLRLRVKNLRMNWPVIWPALAIGFAPFSMQLAAGLLNSILNRQLVNYGGDLAVSAMGIVSSIATLIVMPIFGINQGVQPIIGYNYGARKFDRVKRALWGAVLAATAVVVFGFIVIQLFPAWLIGFFNRDPKLLALGTRALRTFNTMLPVIGFQIVSAAYFQFVGKPRQAMILSLSRQILLLIPALLILPRFFGIDGVFYAGPVSDLGSAMLTGFCLYRELQHLEERHLEGLALEET